MWILVGALIGAVAGAAGAIISAKLRGQEIDWKDVGTAAVTGAVTGAVASATLGLGLLANPVVRTAGGAVLGATAAALSTGLSNELHGRPVTQGLQNAVIAGAVGGALGGLALGPVAPGIVAPTVVRTAISGATGNGAAQVTDNLLEGRPVLENVGSALATGAIVAAGAQVAATRLAPQAELAGTTPRPVAPVRPAITSEPAPVQPVVAPVPAVEAVLPPVRGPPASQNATNAPAQNGIVQILEQLEAPTGQGTTPTGNGTTPTGNGTTPTGNGTTPTGNPTASSATSLPRTDPALLPAKDDQPVTTRPLTNRPLGEEETPAKPAPSQPSPANALRNADQAVIDMRKLTEYALNPEHPVGGNKARVFKSALGFTRETAAPLAEQIRAGVVHAEATAQTVDQHGSRFQVDIPVTGPNGNTANVRTAWIYRPGSDVPELTTLFVAPR